MDFERSPDPWPLERGQTLSNHEWWPFHGHRFLASAFMAEAVLQGRRADLGTALILWAEAMRQDPAGTLPDDDLQLAALARFPSVEAWQEARPGVMHGWVPVLVTDGRTGEVTTRLGHSMLEVVAKDMHKRKRGRDEARKAGARSQRKGRIRKKMMEIGVSEELVAQDRVVAVLVDYFEATPDLFINAENVRNAMISEIGWTGQIAQFPGSRSG